MDKLLCNSTDQTYCKGCFVELKVLAKLQCFRTSQFPSVGLNREPNLTTVNSDSTSQEEIFSECDGHLSRLFYQTAASVHALTVLSC